jgi:hypothetical protein
VRSFRISRCRVVLQTTPVQAGPREIRNSTSVIVEWLPALVPMEFRDHVSRRAGRPSGRADRTKERHAVGCRRRSKTSTRSRPQLAPAASGPNAWFCWGAASGIPGGDRVRRAVALEQSRSNTSGLPRRSVAPVRALPRTRSYSHRDISSMAQADQSPRRGTIAPPPLRRSTVYSRPFGAGIVGYMSLYETGEAAGA